jgi:hypothetical protein
MFMVNRSIVIIRPKQPYLDWVNRVEDTDRKWEMADVSSEPSTYLLPEIDDELAARRFLKKNYKPIFERELDGWHRDSGNWVEPLTYKLFQEWFEIEWGSEIIDLGKGEIEREEWD